MDTITIKAYDEVYVKLDCDPGIMFEIADFFTFEVEGAKFMPAFRQGRWDGKIRILNPMNGLLYKGLVYKLTEFCQSRNYELIDNVSNGDDSISLHEAQEFIKTLNLPFEVRDYQLEAFVHAVRKRRAILLSPTASGKSLIIYLLLRWYNTKSLIIVPTVGLVHQMTGDFVNYGYDEYVHKIAAGQDKLTDSKIVVSTWQSVYKMPKSWFQQFDVIIGDEAHGFKAKSLIEIMTKLTRCKYRFGTTGTLDGSQVNALVLEGLFGKITKVTTTAELMANKHVTELDIKLLLLKHSFEARKLVKDMDYQNEIDYIVTNERRNRFIKNLVLSLEGNTLVMFKFVEKHGKVLYDMIRNAAENRKVFFISGEVDGDVREDIRIAIEDEQNAILVASVGTTSTGINIPSMRNIVFTSPSKTRVKTLQAIGRILRLSDRKTKATLYDIADDLSWKSKKNYTLLHFIERVRIYASEKFKYKNYDIEL